MPIPPSPICSSSLYGPTAVPGRAVGTAGSSGSRVRGGGRVGAAAGCSRKLPACRVGPQQPVHAAPEGGVPGAGLVEEPPPVLGAGISRACRNRSLASGSQSGMVSSSARGGSASLPMRETVPVAREFRKRDRRYSPRESLVEPGAGAAPRAGRRPGGRRPRASAASWWRQPGEVPQLDQPGGLGVVPLERGQGVVEGEQLGRPRPSSATDTCVEVDPPRSPPRLAAALRRARSTRMRRMASAAAAKKCPRPSQLGPRRRPTSRRYASWTRAVASERLAGLLGGHARGGELPQLVVDEREQLGGGLPSARRGRGIEEAGHFGHAGERNRPMTLGHAK